MTKVRAETYVHCPPQRAQRYLVAYLRSLDSDGGGSRVQLTATIGPEDGARVSVSRDALATIVSASDQPLEYKVLIRWTL